MVPLHNSSNYPVQTQTWFPAAGNAHVLHPHLPLLSDMLRLMSVEDPPRDYSSRESISQDNPINLLGYNTPQNWNNKMRIFANLPSMVFQMETDAEIDENVIDFYPNIDFTHLVARANYVNWFDYTRLTPLSWLQQIIPTMALYCKYFKDSSNLGQCAITSPTCPLMRSRLFNQTFAQMLICVFCKFKLCMHIYTCLFKIFLIIDW